MQVQKGDTLLVLEAMKMEYPVTAEASGKVVEVHVESNTLTRQGDVLLTLTMDENVTTPEE
jgi:geranyl-CoA carboxylase alpha subunit